MAAEFVIQLFSTVTESIFIWAVRPRCSINPHFSNTTITYLLTQLLVVVVIVLAGVMFYAIGRELFSGQSPSGIYSRAFKLCKKDEKVCIDFPHIAFLFFSLHLEVTTSFVKIFFLQITVAHNTYYKVIAFLCMLISVCE